MAAFPLGTVLLPGQLLELRVFEPRYRVMLFDLRDRDPAELVVTMIERGSEVGGGDVRAPVGCVARIIDQHDAPDGTTMLTVLGTDRALVGEWLAEDPYPVARVTRLAEEAAHDTAVDPDAPGGLAEALRLGGSVLTLAEALGQPPGARPAQWATSAVEATWQLALATPLATLDRYKLLAEDDPTVRIERLTEMLEEVRGLLEAQLSPPPSHP